MAPPATKPGASKAVTDTSAPLRVEEFLIELADALNTTLDLDTLLSRVAEMVRRVIPYEIFAIMLINEKTQDLRMRFQIGHNAETERLRIKIGQGVTGHAVERGEPVLVNDVTSYPGYVNGHEAVRSELAVPLIAKNKIIGVIDIQSVELNFFTEEHRRLLRLVASRIAISMENARLYTRVARQAQTLRILNEISRDLTSILNLDELLKRVGELISRVIDFQMFSVLLLDESGTKLTHRFSMRFKENVQLKHDIPLGRGLVGAAALQKEPVLVTDVLKDERYIRLNPETRSELCVPLIYKEQVIGVLDLEHTRRGYFNDDNMRTIVTLAAQIAIAIENARLYERIAREEQRLERDLAMAREVQQHLLPPSCPVLKSADVAVKFQPAHAIGGDIYDFLNYSGDRVGIAVGDVSGKGAPAALFAALVGGILRSTAGVEPTPAKMLTLINENLNGRKIDAHFVSMIFAIWDDTKRTMLIANSGQPRPMYCQNGRPQIVEAAGIPLGLLEDTDYDEVTIHAQPGDVFAFFSDGIIDAVDREGEQFGRPRVDEVVAKNHHLSAEGIVTAIFKAVRKFSNGVSSYDDETVVVMKIKDGGSESPATSAKRPRKTSGPLREV
ncbi:MAG TPA: GAF domain-containing protein [Terriglobales bacterium]|nr:GAF domain-containing protein [Terriglobales bacterium]